jgi:rod shape determining protein RodA
MDFPMLLALFLLVALSLITLASFSYREEPRFGDFYKQLIWFGVGAVVFILAANIDYRMFLNYRWMVIVLYCLGIGLILLPYFGPAIRGTHAWIVLGSMRFQPVEFMKIALIILFAKFFSRRHIEIARPRNLLISLGYVAIPVAIVAKQPDLGSALILVGLWGAFVLLSGIRMRHLMIFLLLGAVGAGILWTGFLKEYQKERIVSFVYPNYDPLGANYNINQSKIAIGAGGALGKGIGGGTQVQYGFLPEAKTDFIFAGFVEEWGFLGALFIFGIFAVLLWRILITAHRASNNFAKLFCYGSVSLFMIQFFFNVGANIGILPITGVTFPFFSYGGSSMIMNMFCVGIIEGIAARTEQHHDFLA